MTSCIRVRGFRYAVDVGSELQITAKFHGDPVLKQTGITSTTSFAKIRGFTLELLFCLKNNELRVMDLVDLTGKYSHCLLYTSPSPRDLSTSRMPSSA